MGFLEFNDKQLDRLSDFFSNLGLLIVATLVLPNIFHSVAPDIKDLMTGIVLTIMLLVLSMVFIRKNNE